MSEPVGLGIIGIGSQGEIYARLVHEGRVPGMQLRAIASTNPARRQLAEELGVRLHTDYQALLADPAVEAVAVVTPHYSHPELAIAALQAGKHVVIDKPAGVYSAQVRRLNEVAAAHPELTFAMLYNQRVHPLWAAVQSLVSSGELGELVHTSWIVTHWWRPQGYYEQGAWRATWRGEGGGVLVNQAPHQLDLWQWICGMPVRCFARAAFGLHRAIPVDNEVNASLDFGGGATGQFLTGTVDPAGTDRLEILLDRGKILVENSRRLSVTRFTAPEEQLSADFDIAEINDVLQGRFDLTRLGRTTVEEITSVWGQQHCELLTNFAQAIRTGVPLIAPGVEGINEVLLANAMYLSAWTGQDIDLRTFDDDAFLAELNRRVVAEGGAPLS